MSDYVNKRIQRQHYLIVFYLFAILIYIAFFAWKEKIFMLGFLISTLFMLFYQIHFWFKIKKSLKLSGLVQKG
ncbi:hypothetical protein AB3329_11190 [Streptococcus sp. H31]|uniref:hypothetical protein n=1 Tax=Streptococcus huangxiaojuni TaxID=3237239 RepID=UPI0034A28384